jgi:hypothetical protein
MGSNINSLKNTLISFDSSNKISQFIIRAYRIGNDGYTDFSFFEEIFNISNSNINIDLICCEQSSSWINKKCVSLYGLRYVSGLKEFNGNGMLPNLFDISELEYFYNSIENLNLSECAISSCSSFSKLKKLKILNLKNNDCLSDTVSYKVTAEDGSETTVTENNVHILASLNYNAGNGGALKYLYLSGTGIINYDELKNYTWTEKSGF